MSSIELSKPLLSVSVSAYLGLVLDKPSTTLDPQAQAQAPCAKEFSSIQFWSNLNFTTQLAMFLTQSMSREACHAK
jgi:hypothetical protein